MDSSSIVLTKEFNNINLDFPFAKHTLKITIKAYLNYVKLKIFKGDMAKW